MALHVSSVLSAVSDQQDFQTDVVLVTFFADEFLVSDTPTGAASNQILAPVQINDDDLDEASEQLFVVLLDISTSVNPSFVNNSERNISLCRIRDNDGEF
jgi:hypothetical protein